jgi:hypothetical protein
MINKIDGAIMAQADHLVAWLWDRCEIKRIILLRVALVGWIGGNVGDRAMLHEPLAHGGWDMLWWMVMALLVWATERIAMRGVVYQNATAMYRRASPMHQFLRMFSMVFTVLNLPLSHTPFRVVDWVCWVVYYLLSDTFVPDRPGGSKRRKRVKAPAMAWEGAR